MQLWVVTEITPWPTFLLYEYGLGFPQVLLCIILHSLIKKLVFLWYLLITCTITIPPIIFKLYSNYLVNWCRNVIRNGNSFLILSASPYFVKLNPVSVWWFYFFRDKTEFSSQVDIERLFLKLFHYCNINGNNIVYLVDVLTVY